MEICHYQSSVRIRVFHYVVCSVVGRHRHFGGICCCLLQGIPEISFPKGLEVSPFSPPNGESKGKGKAVPFTGLEWPRGFQEVMVPRCHDNGTGWW